MPPRKRKEPTAAGRGTDGPLPVARRGSLAGPRRARRAWRATPREGKGTATATPPAATDED